MTLSSNAWTTGKASVSQLMPGTLARRRLVRPRVALVAPHVVALPHHSRVLDREGGALDGVADGLGADAAPELGRVHLNGERGPRVVGLHQDRRRPVVLEDQLGPAPGDGGLAPGRVAGDPELVGRVGDDLQPRE